MRILIVEDDAAMARGLAERLKLSGFAVDIESDGASAAQTALLEPYSLIISGYQPSKRNYANHAGFWLVKESFGMTMGEATKTISVIQSIVALVGLGMVLLMNLFPGLPS